MSVRLAERIARARAMGEAHYKWQRERMWKHNPRCNWCGVVTTLLHEYPDKVNKGQQQDNWATLDHLDPKWSRERGKYHGKFRLVLSCWKCNNDRNRAEQARRAIQQRWLECGQFYRIAKLSGALNEVTA